MLESISIDRIVQFMLLPQFLATFGNGTKAPWMIGPDSKMFAEEISKKVQDWVLDRLIKK
jgi:hypothetical protein